MLPLPHSGLVMNYCDGLHRKGPIPHWYFGDSHKLWTRVDWDCHVGL